MNLTNFPVGWVDFVVVLVILLGVIRGRRRGMSEELLDVIKWIGIVAVASLTYEPAGSFMASTLPFSRLSCYLTAYLAVIVGFKLTFALLKKQMGEKLVGSDVFGRAEYYLGMMAGAVRYTCVLIAVFAMINARHYSPEEIRAEDNYQLQNYGAHFFPTMYSFQRQVFEGAWTGRFSREYAPFLLIRPTDPEDKGLRQSGIARARERDFNDALDKR